MASKLFLTVHSAIYAFFALALFFVPDVLWPVYGLEVNDQYARFLSQHNSIFLGGLAFVGFLLRDLTGEYLEKLLMALMWANGLGFIITLYACLIAVFTGLGWSDPMFFGFLTLLCYLQIRKMPKM